MQKNDPGINWQQVDRLIEMALAEDLDSAGDVTTDSVVGETLMATAVLRCKEPDMVVAGQEVARRSFSGLIRRPNTSSVKTMANAVRPAM